MTADAEGADPPRRAVLQPAEWCVRCPACDLEIAVAQTREDDAGAIHAADGDQFFQCEECGTFIVAVAASVQEAYPA